PSFASGATAAAGQGLRLPGIETFDHVQHRPTTPPRRNMTPVHANTAPAPLLAAPNIDGPRRGHASWDGSRPSQYPDIDDSGRPATHWGQQTLDQLDQLRDNQQKRSLAAPPVMGPPPHSMGFHQPQHIAAEALNLQSSAKRVKRAGAYNRPQPVQRTSPEDSSSSDGIPTPGTSTAEINPAIMYSNGYIEPQVLASAGDAHAQHTVSRGKA
ncbi:Up in starvation, partial [Neophaeococcomyces mojaviensis]